MIIDIKIEDHKPIKEFFKNLHSHLEDLLFSITYKLPEKFISHWLMNWLDRYLDKRISELKQESIKLTWKNLYLQEAVDNIKNPDK